MILYEVVWDNGEQYEDNQKSSLVFTSLEKAKEYYNQENIAEKNGYGIETLTIYSFESDIIKQKRTKIESRVIYSPDFYESDIAEKWEDDFNYSED